MSESAKKYTISHISERDKKTIVTVETDEELSEWELARILSEVMMNIQTYLMYSKQKKR